MILYEDMKPIAQVQLHPICVLSYLMCACNKKLSLCYWTHWNCWWTYHFNKKQIYRDSLWWNLYTQVD